MFNDIVKPGMLSNDFILVYVKVFPGNRVPVNILFTNNIGYIDLQYIITGQSLFTPFCIMWVYSAMGERCTLSMIHPIS